MYLNLVTKKNTGIQNLTFGSLIYLSQNQDKFCELGFVVSLYNKITLCASLATKLRRNPGVYRSILMKNVDIPNADFRWKERMIDIDWSSFKISEYTPEIWNSIKEIVEFKPELSDVEALILLCNNLDIDLEYINKDSDAVHIDATHPYCTKRVVKYFRNLLVKIPRSEYLRLRKIDTKLAIKSGNFFYKNKNLNEAFIRNSML